MERELQRTFTTHKGNYIEIIAVECTEWDSRKRLHMKILNTIKVNGELIRKKKYTHGELLEMQNYKPQGQN